MVKSLIARAYTVLQQEGARVLTWKSTRYLWRIIRRNYKQKTYWYWKFKGHKTIYIGGLSASFSILGKGDYKELLYLLDNEQEELCDVLSEINDGDVFLDIGSNIGIYSIYAHLRGANVMAIEPHPINVAHLLLNRELNGADIYVYQCALSDVDGYADLSSPFNDLSVQGSASLPGGRKANEHDSDFFVHTVRGDALLSDTQFKTPNVIKIDVQGAEYAVLAGLRNTLQHPDCQVVFCEIHHHRGVELDDITKLLKDCGFSTNGVRESKNITRIKATKTH